MSQAINVQALNTLSAAIKEQLQIIGKATFETGRLLCEAQDLLPKKSDIVVWAQAEVSLKKAQTYRLMSVYRAFAGQEWAEEMAVDALVKLIGDEDAQEVVKGMVESGEKPSTKDVNEIVNELAEEKGEKAPENTPEAPKEKTPAQLAKDLEKAEKRAEQQAVKFEQKEKEFKKARDLAVNAARTMEQELADAKKKIEELESANSVKATIIAQQHETIAALRAQLEGQPAGAEELAEEPQIDTVGETDDLPWEDEAEEVEVAHLDESLIPTFKAIYVELQKANPRKMVDNTKEAAEKAGIEMTGTGRAVKFDVFGKQMTGSELRALIK